MLLCVFLYTCNNPNSTERSLVITGKNSAKGLVLTVSKQESVWPANVRTGSDARTSRSWPRAQATLHNLLIGNGHAGAGIFMYCVSAKTCWLCSEPFAHIRKLGWPIRVYYLVLLSPPTWIFPEVLFLRKMLKCWQFLSPYAIFHIWSEWLS